MRRRRGRLRRGRSSRHAGDRVAGTRIDRGFDHCVIAFRAGLAEAGYVEGQNVGIDYRWAEGQVDRLPMMAGGSGARAGRVICAGGAPAALAAKAATTNIPMVFPGGEDPVKFGLASATAA